MTCQFLNSGVTSCGRISIQVSKDATFGAPGFSTAIAQWAATNLKPADGKKGTSSTNLAWSFDLEGIRDLYQSYEETDLYPILEQPPLGVRIDFVRAEKSSFRWGGEDEARIMACGHRVHLLRNSGHWVRGITEITLQSYDFLDSRLAPLGISHHVTHLPDTGSH